MQQRPKLTIKLCGQANAKDKQAITQRTNTHKESNETQTNTAVTQEVLLELAKHRAVQVKRLFIDKGIVSERVFLCQASYKKEATNGVTMTM